MKSKDRHNLKPKMELNKINKLQINSIIKDIISARQLADFEAVEVLWVALVKFPSLLPGKNEHKRILNLVNCISPESINNIVLSHTVSDLLQLDPPLETEDKFNLNKILTQCLDRY